MADPAITRVKYFPQQFLRTSDFEAEQAYHLQMRRRHNVAHHVWGIVAGLQLTMEEQDVFIEPGMAVDGFGRELVVSERYRLPLKSAFAGIDGDELDVWLIYSLRGTDDPLAPSARCDTQLRGLYYRQQEVAVVYMQPPDINYPDPRRPAPVAQAKRESAPQHSPSDDPRDRWPVYLGRVIRDRSDPAAVVLSVEMQGRPMVGAIADSIVSPTHPPGASVADAVVRVRGREGTGTEGSAPGDSARFGVELRHRHGQTDYATEHLGIDGTGDITLRGRTRLVGDLTLERGTLAFGSVSDPNELPDCTAAPDRSADGPRPFRMYRYRVTEGEGEDEKELFDELRVELPQGNDSAQFVVGAWSADEERFVEFLTVKNGVGNEGQGRVIVHGDLIVRGEIVKDIVAAAPRLTREARNHFLSTFSGGVSGANVQLDSFYKSKFNDFRIDTEEGRQGLVDLLVATPDYLDDFVEKLLASAPGTDTVFASEELRRQLNDASDSKRTKLTDMIVALDEAPRTDVLTKLLDALLSEESTRDLVADKLLEHGGAASIGKALAKDGTLADTTPVTRPEQSEITSVLSAVLVETSGPELVGSYLASTAAPGGPDSQLRGVIGEITKLSPAAEVLGQELAATAQPTPARFADVLLNVIDDPDARAAVIGLLFSAGAGGDIGAALLALTLGSATERQRAADTLEPLVTTAPEFVLQRLYTNSNASTEVGDYLIAHATAQSDVLEALLANAVARGRLVTQVVEYDEASNAIGIDAIIAFLELPGSSTRSGLFAAAVADSGNFREDVVAAVLSEDGGRADIVGFLNAVSTPVGVRDDFASKAAATDPLKTALQDALTP